MRVFVFTCLLAVALATHEIKERSEKYRQEQNVAFQKHQVTSSVSSSEESIEVPTEKNEQIEKENVYMKQLNKIIKEFYQKFYFPQYPQVYQQQMLMNPRTQMKTTAYPVPAHEMTRIPQKGIIRKIADTDTSTNEFREVKFNQFHQLVIPQYFQALQQQRMAVNPWFRINPYHPLPVLA